MDKTLRAGAGIIVGSLLYVVLNWIPLLGPLLVGVAAGRVSKTGGFTVGFFSGILGFAFLLYSVFPRWGISGNPFLLWILLLWNLVGMFLAGLGGSFGSTAGRTFSYRFGSWRGRGPGPGGEGPERESIESSDVLVVCPSCGASNPENSARCGECGGPL